ncbi:MAG: hypothetical protein B6I38_08810 [Anaerolineaceae bacterium 4572_5.1]|nr:MAG: hypothetical protein B6I38_08810 [Anaerolineaceae bacterium 4572_5.1]
MNLTSMDFPQLALVAFLIESLVQTFKPLHDKEKGWNRDAVIALIVGVVVCVATKVDLFAAVGLPIKAVPFLGAVLTGILASRGSNFVHDIFKFIESKSETPDYTAGPVG